MPRTQKQRDAWKHNSFLGHARMMQTQARAIVNSTTATIEAKNLAGHIESTAAALAVALKIRRPNR